MSALLVSMMKSSMSQHPEFRRYMNTLVLRELVKKTPRCPPTSVRIPERRRVSFYADEGWEMMAKPPPSTVATYNSRSYDAFRDAFEGLISVKTRAQIEAEEFEQWQTLKARATSNAWKPKRTRCEELPKTPADLILEEFLEDPIPKSDEEKVLEQLAFCPLDINNLPGLRD